MSPGRVRTATPDSGEGSEFESRAGVAPEPPLVSATVLGERARLTYRQVDYWTTRGYLAPVGEPNPGSGSDVARRYPPEAVYRAILLGRLTRLGLPLGLAAHLLDTRTIDPEGGWVARLDDGLVVVAEPESYAAQVMHNSSHNSVRS